MPCGRSERPPSPGILRSCSWRGMIAAGGMTVTCFGIREISATIRAMSPLHIGNACGFWGDWAEAPVRLVRQAPQLDVLTLDYLAEVSMSVLARQRTRQPELGYPRDFLEVIRSLAPVWAEGRRLKLVTNAGGLNPRGCADAAAAILRDGGCAGRLRIGIVSGDDVLSWLRDAATSTQPGEGRHLETAQPIADIADRLVTANAYLGAAPIVEALRGGA